MSNRFAKASQGIALLGGGLLLAASFLPWLVDALHGDMTAWQIPLNLGWQFQSSSVNYGLLCLVCALYVWLVAWASWKPFRGAQYFAGRYRTAALACAVPVVLLVWQFLFSDVNGINVLAQHSIQQLLISHHFGYSIAPERISVSPLLLDTGTLGGRGTLLVNALAVGPLLALVSMSLLLVAWRLAPQQSRMRSVRWHVGWGVAGIALVLVILARAPLAMACESEASSSLTMGSYAEALQWLSAAVVLNPALQDAAEYHIERGQAIYYRNHDVQSDDSRAFIAATYRAEGDYSDAYTQFLPVWQAHNTAPWAMDEASTTLERLAEYIQPLHGPPVRRPEQNDTALPWVQLLISVDSTSVYGHYLVGRIQYDLHNYGVSVAEMNTVLKLSGNRDIQSSAYTYIALSEAGRGDYVTERVLLLKAVQLDPNYHNNTAREDLSGLR